MKKFYTLFLCLSFLFFGYKANAACSITVLSQVNTCGGQNNGQIEINVKDLALGATNPFIISWTGAASGSSLSFSPANPNDFNYTLTGLIAGSYTITATGGGCSASIVQVLSNAPFLAVTPAYNTTGSWNVYCYQSSGNLAGTNTSAANFVQYGGSNYRGFYTSSSKTISTPPGCTICANSFEFNTKDGWNPWKNPSGATSIANTFGKALTTYSGCDLPNDKFAFVAKRKGFACGYYYITKYDVDDDVRVTIKPDGIAGTTFVVPITAGCSLGSACDIWEGYLGPNSTIDFECFDLSNDSKFQIEFYRNEAGHPLLTANAGTNLTKCNGSSLNVTGSSAGGSNINGANATGTDYTYSWTPTGSVTNSNAATMTTAINANTTYTFSVTDKVGCTATSSMNVTISPANAITMTTPVKICGNSTSSVTVAYANATTGLHSVNVAVSPALAGFPVTVPVPIGTVTGSFSLPVAALPAAAVGTYVFTVTDTNPAGCTKSNTVSVIKGNNPTLTFPTSCSQTTGSGTSVLATGGLATYTYSWSPLTNITSPSGTTANPQINLLLTTPSTYTVTVTDAAGCTNSASVSVNPQPSIILTPTYNVCVGTSVLLSYFSVAGFGSASDYTYSVTAGAPTLASFVPVNNVSLTSLSLPIPAGAAAGTYGFNFILKSTITGCTKSYTFTVTIGAAFTAAISSSATALGCTANAVLTATPAGATYNWSNGFTTQTNTVTTAATYTVTVTNGCSSTATFTLGASATPPTLTQSFSGPGKITCTTASITLTATAAGGVSPYTWSGTGGFTSATATTATVLKAAGGSYVVTVTDKNNCTATTSFFLDDRTGPSAGIYSGFPKLCGVTPVILTATPPSATVFSWLGGTKTITALGSQSSTVTDINGCVGTATVIPSASVQPTFTTADATICKGATATISATGAAGFDDITGTSGFLGTDIPNNSSTGLSSPIVLTGGVGNVSATSTIKVNLSISHRYIDDVDAYLVGPGNCGAMLLFNDSPSGKSMTGTTLTTGTGTLISAGTAPFVGTPTAGTAYKMIGGIATAPVLVSPPTGTVLPSAAAISGCPVNGSWKLLLYDDAGSITGSLLNWSISINNGQGLFTHSYNVTGATAAAPTYSGGTTQPNSSSVISGLNTVGYVNGDVSVSNGNGCPTKKTFQIKVFGIPAITTLTPTCATTSASADGAISVAATLDNGNFIAPDIGVIEYALSATGPWQTSANFTGLVAGNYTVYTRNSKSTTCVSSQAVTVGFKPVVTLVSSLATVGCGATSTTLTATGGGTYAWDNGLSAVANPTATVTATTTYTVTVTTAGCSNTKSVTVNFDSTPPTATAVATNPTLNCTITSTTLTAGGGGTYNWSNALGMSSTTAAVSPSTTNTYTVTVTGTNGCTATKTVTVTVSNALPTVTATAANPSLDCNNASTTLTATGGGTYAWSNTLGTSATTGTISPASTTTYTVTVTAANNCTATQTVTVTVDKAVPTPTSAIAATPTIDCNTPTTTLTASGGSTYLWSDGLGTSATTTPVSPATTKTYTVTITGANGCTVTKSVSVTVDKAAPTSATASATTPTINCNTPTTTLTASGGSTYLWNNTLGTSATTSAVSPAATTLYSVTVSSANGCSVVKTVNVTVDKAVPSGTASATTPNLDCSTTSTTLTATGGGTYAWSNSLGTSATTAAVSPTTNTTYTVTVTGTNGCTATKTVDVVVDANLPIATTSAATPIVTCITQSTTLTATGGTAYAWSNSLGTSATTAAVTPTTNTTYSVTVTAANGCSVIKTIAVTVDKTAPTATATATTPTVNCTTPSTTLTATGGGTYAWSNSLGSGAISLSATPTAATTYTVTVTGTNGCTATKTVTVNVDLTAPTATATAVTPTVTCTTPSTTLTATGGLTYNWDNGLGTNATTTAVAPTTATTFNVTVTGANGCTSTKAITVNVNKTAPTVTATAALPTVTCASPSTTLTATGGGTYLWTSPLGTSATSALVMPTTATTYTVTVTSPNGCTATKDVTVNVDISTPTATVSATTSTITCTTPATTMTATGGTSYAWSDGLGTAATSSLATPSGITGTKTYTVTVTAANGCSSIKTVDIVIDKIVPTITATATTPTVNCTTSSTTLTATGGGTYAWSNSLGTSATSAPATPTSATTYTVTVTGTNGCTATKTVTVNVDLAVPTATATAVTPTVTCTTPSTTLTASGGLTYNWNNGLGTSATTAAVMPTNTTTYNVTVTSANGCTSTKAITVNVDKTAPTVTATAALPTVTCASPSTTLTATGGGAYAWTSPLGTSATSASVTPTTATTYTVTVTSPNGCTATKDVTVNVDISAPTATVSATTSTVTCTTPATTMTATGGTSYAWSDGLGTAATSSLATPSGITGTKTYTVTVSADNGCSSIKTIDIVIDKIVPTVTATATTPTVNCTTPSTTLTATGGGTYAWTSPLGTSATSASVTPITNTTYSVTVTATNGCTATKDVTVTVDKTDPTANATAVPTTVTCTTPATTMTATGGTAYAWSDGLGTAAVSTPATPTGTTGTKTYTVTVTAANGCTATKDVIITKDKTEPTATTTATTPTITCGTPSTTLTATGGGTYNWTAPLGTAATTAAVSPATNTTYSVTVTAANGCSVVKTVDVVVNKDAPNLSISPINPVINCNNISQVLTANSTDVITAYQWTSPLGTAATATVNPSVTTPYSVTATATNGCTATQSVSVTVDTDLPSVTFTNIKDTITCTNTSTTITATGGNFNWSGGLGTSGSITVSPTATTTYTVTITAINGCFVTKDTTIYVNTTKPTVSVTPATAIVNCANSSVTLTATGGATYSWSNAAGITPVVTVSPTTGPVTYTVTVTGTNGCTQTGSTAVTVNITMPTATITPLLPVINCNNASANLTASGGISYDWSAGLGTTPAVTATPIATTTYTVTITDINGCTATKSVEVKVEEPLVIACAQKSGTTTVTATDGVGEITITGGAPNFTIKYQFGTNAPVTIPGSNGSNLIQNLAAGAYDVTVTDASGCTKTCTFSIAGVSCNIALTLTQSTPLSCFGGNNAALNLVVTAATGTKTYNWNPSALGNTATPSALTAGTYEVTVSDAVGCTAIASILVNNPTEILVNVDANNDVKCFGTATGSVEVSATGGSTPFQFKVDAGAYQASGVFAGLAVGAHTITAKDANNCTKTITVTIAEPTVLALSIATQLNSTCNGANDGEVTVSATGGTPSYQYKLDAGALGGSATISNISTGVHTITVEDANGCTKTVNFTITEPIALSLSINNIVNVTCNAGSDGTFTASANGGTAPFEYKIDAGTFSTSANFTGVSVGNHTVTVKDSKGCEKSTTATIGEPLAIVLVCEQVSPVTVVAATDGVAKVTISNGIAPYTIAYAIGTATATTIPSVLGVNTITGLAAGQYNVTVTDSKGCTSVCGFTINNPNCNINAALTNSKTISCANGNDGEITVNLTGGTAPFTYNWNPASAGSSPTATGLVAGTYAVTITDASGCLANASLTIGDPTVLGINVNFLPAVACNGGKTDVVVTASGGTAPYTGTGTFNVSQGTYTYTVTDAKNCTSSTSITITEPSAIDVQVSITEPILCNGGTGKVSVSATGGTAPYSGIGVFTVSEGIVNYVVTDNNGCTKSTSITITEPQKIELVCEQASPTSTVGGANGTGNVNISNGTAPYKIDYKFGANLPQTIANGVSGNNPIPNLTSGSFSVTVTDANGCTATCGFGIAEVNCNMAAVLTQVNTIKCNGDQTASLNLVVTNGQGALVYNWNEITLDGQQNPVSLPAGNYAITITDERLCKAVQSITINQPNKLIAQGFGAFLLCGATSSSVEVRATGGTAPYTGTGFFTQAIGTQPYNITDANGCTTTTTCSVSPGIDMILDCQELTPTAVNGSNGVAVVNIKNGQPQYKIQWAGPNGGTSSSGMKTGNNGGNLITGLEEGTYTVTVTDAFGCSKECGFTINTTQSNCKMTATLELIKPVTCHNGADAEILVKHQNGAFPYTYDWNPFFKNDVTNPKNIGADTYYVTVTDGKGCKVVKSLIVQNPAEIVVSAVIDSIKCNGDKGQIVISALLGTAPYTGIGTFNEPKGTYNYLVKDSKGCSVTKTVTLLDPTPLVINCAALAKVTTAGGTEGTASVAISGAKAPYSMTYTNGTTNGTLSNLAPGSQSLTLLTKGEYTVTVKDKNDCTDTCTFTILENVKPGCKISLTLKQDKTINCYGSASASILTTVKDGQDKVTYDWNDNTLDGIENPSGLKAGTYILTVKDTAGCTDTKSITITQPAQLLLTCGATAAVTSLNGKEGKATISISGGNATYKIDYTNGTGPNTTTDVVNSAIKGANSISNLTAGTYTVIVTDKNGCMDTCSFTVNTNIAGCTLTSALVATKQIACFGNKDGELKLTITGGTAPFVTTWNQTGLPNSGAIPNLTAGTYSATITDAKGCVTNVSATLKDPAALIINSSSVAIKCFGDSSIVKITATGGTLPLAGIGNFKQAAGSKTFTVTDKNGCTTSTLSTLTQPTAINIVCKAISAENNGNKDGSGSITINGSKAPYSVAFTHNGNTSTIASVAENVTQKLDTLSKGLYKIVVTDANGCKDTCSFTIGEVLCNLKASINITQNIACWNTKDGQLTAVITKGSAPFGIKWSTGATNISIDNLAAGTYKVTITDGKNCIDTAKVTLIKPVQSPVVVLNPIDTINCKNTAVVLSAIDTTKNPNVKIGFQLTLGNTIPNGKTTSTPGTYDLIAIDPVLGCSVTQKVTVFENKKTIQVNAGKDIVTNACLKDTVSLEATSTNNFINALWKTNSGNIISDPADSKINVDKNGTYIFSAQHPSSFCESKDTVVVTSKQMPLIANAGLDRTVCGDTVQLFANNVNGVWSVKNGGQTTDIKTKNKSTTFVTNLALGDSRFIWTAILGTCKTEDEVRVQSIQSKAFEAKADAYQVTQPFPQFVGNVAANDKFIGGINVKILEPANVGTVIIGTKGSFEFKAPDDKYNGLVLFSYQLCSEICPNYCSEGFASIDVLPAATTLTDTIPFVNVFSPNDDGINDVFVIPGIENLDFTELTVVNRWGDIVYQASPYRNDWGGRYKGKPLPEGTYYYIFRVGQDLKPRKIYRGSVTIIK
jgi:gliding motility-associated-like protein